MNGQQSKAANEYSIGFSGPDSCPHFIAKPTLPIIMMFIKLLLLPPIPAVFALQIAMEKITAFRVVYLSLTSKLATASVMMPSKFPTAYDSFQPIESLSSPYSFSS